MHIPLTVFRAQDNLRAEGEEKLRPGRQGDEEEPRHEAEQLLKAPTSWKGANKNGNTVLRNDPG